jgi:aryl-alcohol dehydrogenase-like predicted oxidoreductase
LASGALTGKYLEGVPEGSRASLEGYEWLKKGMIDSDRGQDRMRRVATYIKIAEQYSLSPSQLAIAWCLLNQNVSTVILGASSIEQLQNNLGSLNCMEALNNEDLTKSLSTIGL